MLEDVCFDAQQAAEKAFKALLVLRGVHVPRTHSISDLLTTLAQLGFAVPEDVQDASEPVVVEDYDTAVATATRVAVWVSRIVEERFET